MRRQLMRLALENAFIDVNKPPSHDDALIMAFRKSFGHLYPTPPVVIEHNPIGRPYLAMEEIANGQPVKEIEHTFYARVVSPSDLEQAASKENHEQWEIRLEKSDQVAGKGSMRVRKTWLDGKEEEATFVRTSKVVMNDKGDKIELPLPSNVDEFTVFKFLAPQGMRKTRFTFPIIGTNLKWEIDMFPKQDGEGFHEWCKIDLEVQDRNQPIPEFPIPLDDVILPEGYGRTGGPEVQDQVTKLYDEFFLLKNQFLPKQTEMAPATAQDEGIATSVAALPNDTAEPAVLDAGSSSDEAPAVTPETPNQDLPDAVPAQQSTDSPQAALDQALNQGVPDNLQVAPEPVIQEPTTGAEPPAEPVQEPGTPNAEPAQAQAPAGQATDPVNGGDAVTPEPSQPGVEPPAAVEPDLATKPEQPEEPIDDAKAEDQSVVEASKDEQEQQAEQTQSTTQTKVDALQAEKKAEAESQGKLDPTEDGKVPVDLIDNPAGDPSVMEPDTDTPEGAGEETSNGGNVTGATDGTDPDANALGTGDGLGGDLADGAGTTGTDAPDINDQDATDPGSEEGTEPTSTAGTAEGANGEGVDNSEVNGEQQVAANAPSKAETDEIPPEDKRKEEALQKQ